jgi:hypothetical protein
MILVSFAFGLLPFLDNFAHIGGFIAGILTGLVFMPVVYFSKRDKYIKLGLRVIALPLIVMLIVLGLTNFYKGVNNCSWCKYLRYPQGEGFWANDYPAFVLFCYSACL